ncbi:MAG: hypothetical protein U1E93_00710 [Alphaproteobacteria bacterium]
MIRQILVSLPTFPDPAPPRMLEGVAGLAQSLGARLTAQIPQLNQDEASWPVVMGTFAADVPQMMRESVTVSERNAQAQSELLQKACVSAGVMLDIRRSVTPLYPSADALVDLARLHDLVILPVPQIEEFDRNYVAAAIFDSGRPTMLVPSGPAPSRWRTRHRPGGLGLQPRRCGRCPMQCRSGPGQEGSCCPS